MRFEILGPMRVCVGDRTVWVTGELERGLLGILLLHPALTVPADRLSEALWDPAAPRNGRGRLHSCVSRLRRRLAAGGVPIEVIATDPDGYRISVDSNGLDLLEFRELVARARDAVRAGRPREAMERYRAALSLWRGPALGGIRNVAVRQAAAVLDEEHAQVSAERIEAELAVGAAGELVGELTELVHRFPYQERLHAGLMLALYRADRQAESLAAYQRVHRLLVAELGQEPGPALRELHHRILTSDPTLRSTTADSDGVGTAGSPAGQYLPRTVADFTGRDRDLGWLLTQAEQVDSYASPVLAVDGMPGVGKTTLAARAAHQLTPRFPDGQLFIDLRGHSGHPPADPAAALGVLLGQLGVPAGQIPADVQERVARWRSELAGRRVLLVLDNAASGAQVTPLLPAGGGSLTLVTSRHRLLDLDGAHPRGIETLPPDDAVTLLERIAGDRVRAEPDAAAEIAKVCGYLPLALRLAATRLAHRPSWRVRDLADRLAEPPAPFTELDFGERTLAGAFRLSYQQLSPEGQHALSRVSLHPANDLDPPAVAALTDTPLTEARRLLDELSDAHLIEEPRNGRYRLHDLVRTFVSALAAPSYPKPDHRAAIGRLLDYYIHATVVASNGLHSRLSERLARRDLQLADPARPDLLAEPHTLGAAWLERERANLVIVARYALAIGFHQRAWRLARAVSLFLARRGHLDDLIDIHRAGLEAAELAGDADAAAGMRSQLAFALTRIGRYDEATVHLRVALLRRQTTHDRTGEAAVRRDLFLTYLDAGRLREAEQECEHALTVARDLDDPAAFANVLVNAAYIHRRMGRLAEALRFGRRSLLLANEVGDPVMAAVAVGNIGAVRARMGDDAAAARLLLAGALAARRCGERHAEAEALGELGSVHRARGEYAMAVEHQRQALTLLREAGFRLAELTVYNELGRTLCAAGDITSALELHRQALAGTSRLRHRYEQARALDGIAACLRDSDPPAARRHSRQALRIFRELDHPDQHEVERHVAGITAGLEP